MTDVHLEDIDVELLEDGPVKDELTERKDDIYFPNLVMSLVKQVDSLQKSIQADVGGSIKH